VRATATPGNPSANAAALLGSGRRLSELELKAEVEQHLERLQRAHAHVYIPRKDLDYAITVGLRMLKLRRLVEEQSILAGSMGGIFNRH